MSVYKCGIINKQDLIFLYVTVFCMLTQHTIKYYIIIYYHQNDKNIKINIYISLSNCIKNHQKINNSDKFLPLKYLLFFLSFHYILGTSTYFEDYYDNLYTLLIGVYFYRNYTQVHYSNTHNTHQQQLSCLYKLIHTQHRLTQYFHKSHYYFDVKKTKIFYQHYPIHLYVILMVHLSAYTLTKIMAQYNHDCCM